MAQRRQSKGGSIGLGIGAGLSSIGQQLQGISEKRMENDLIMERQAALSKQNDMEAANRAKEAQKVQLLEKALSDPVFARRLQQSGLDKVLGMDIPEPTSEDILGPMGASLSGADTEAKVDTPEGMINQVRSSGGIISDTPVQGQTQVPPMGIAQLLAARNAKQAKFTGMAAAEPVTNTRMGPTGVEERFYSTAGEVAGQSFPTERTTRQEAGRAGSVRGAEAGAATNATERALHSPANIAGAAQRAGAISKATAEDKPATDSQARAAGLLGPLLVSNQGATVLEKQGVRLNLGTQTLGNVPGGPALLSEEQTSYLQYAQNFMNIATLIMTGVTARPDEYKRYTATLFGQQGEGPALILQKQAARKAFLESVRQRAARGEKFASLDEMMSTLGIPENGAAPTGSLQDRFRQEMGR